MRCTRDILCKLVKISRFFFQLFILHIAFLWRSVIIFYFMLQLSCMFSKSELVFTLVNQNFMINMTEVCFIYVFTAFCNQNTMINKTINQVFYLNMFYFWFLTVQSGLELTVFIMLFILWFTVRIMAKAALE